MVYNVDLVTLALDVGAGKLQCETYSVVPLLHTHLRFATRPKVFITHVIHYPSQQQNLSIRRLAHISQSRASSMLTGNVICHVI